MYEESYYLLTDWTGDRRTLLLVGRYDADDFLMEYLRRHGRLPFIIHTMNIEEKTFDELQIHIPLLNTYENA